MLGFAFSEAQRSQELMKHLQSRKTVGGASVGTGGGGEGNDDVSGGNTAGAHRRRRRRRTKKFPGGPMSSSTGSVSTGSRSTSGSLYSNGAHSSSMHSRSSAGSGGSGPTIPTQHRNPAATTTTSVRPKQHDAPMTKRDLYFSLRCGMVSTGPAGKGTAVGRVTMVNWDNQIVLDTFVKVPPAMVFDYRTEETGITAELLNMTSSLRFDTARTKVGKLIRGKILIGHGLEVDLSALGLVHPWSDVRDTATYAPFMKPLDAGDSYSSCPAANHMLVPRPLGGLMSFALGRGLNADQPSLVREAIGCLELYKCTRANWEKELVQTIQQKERQREMVLNMRNQLSSIKEDSVIATGVVGSVTSSGHHVRLDDYETYEDSTIASSSIATEPTHYSSSNNNNMYYNNTAVEQFDDHSDNSSFVTRDTDPDPDLQFLRLRLDDAMDIPSHIENLSQLDALHAAGLREQQQQHPFSTQAPGSSTAYGSVSFPQQNALAEERSHSTSRWSQGSSGTADGLAATMAGGGIWTAPQGMRGSTQNSVGSADWSHSSPVKAAYELPPTAASGKDALRLSWTEQDVLEHLPSLLLVDLEQQEIIPPAPSSDRSNQSITSDEQKKKGWFGRERRKSSSNNSGGVGGGIFGGTNDRSSAFRRDNACKSTIHGRSGASSTASDLKSSGQPWYPAVDYAAAKQQQAPPRQQQQQQVFPPRQQQQQVGAPPGFY